MSCESKIDLASALCRIEKLERPPWDVLSSMELADSLGVSLQVLANWRVRSKGPAPEPNDLYRGNRTFYRIDKVLSWIKSQEGEATPVWEIIADWLAARHFFPRDQMTELGTWRIVDRLRGWNTHSVHHRPRRRISFVEANAS